jgi:hypothetical protein
VALPGAGSLLALDQAKIEAALAVHDEYAIDADVITVE